MGRLAAVATALASAGERRLGGLGEREAVRLADTIAVVREDHPGIAEADLDEKQYQPLLDFFDLDAVDADLLTIAASIDLDPNLALAAMMVAGDTVPGWVTAGLAMELAGLGTLDPTARARFARSSAAGPPPNWSTSSAMARCSAAVSAYRTGSLITSWVGSILIRTVPGSKLRPSPTARPPAFR